MTVGMGGWKCGAVPRQVEQIEQKACFPVGYEVEAEYEA